MRQLLVAGLFVTFFGAAVALAADKPNPSGTWKLTVDINGSPTEFTLKLNADGKKLTGSLINEDGKATALKDVKFENGALSFTVIRDQDGEKMSIKNTAKLAGDTMKGKAEANIDGDAQTFPWEGKRLVAAKPAAKTVAAKQGGAALKPAGAWALSVDVNGSPYEFTLKLKGDAQKLSGCLVGDDGKENPLQTVSYKDGTLLFTVIRDQDGEKMPVKCSGKLTGNTIKGKAEATIDGDAQTFPWEAKRVVEKPAAKSAK